MQLHHWLIIIVFTALFLASRTFRWVCLGFVLGFILPAHHHHRRW
jgi:hypothetical protein